MKKILFLLLIALCISCKGELEVISAKKQTVIPGVKTAKKHTKYQIQFKNTSSVNKSIDSILISENNTCYKVNFGMHKDKSPQLIKETSGLGLYIISASLIDGNHTKSTNCSSSENEVIIYYKIGKSSKKLVINSFIEERKTMR